MGFGVPHDNKRAVCRVDFEISFPSSQKEIAELHCRPAGRAKGTKHLNNIHFIPSSRTKTHGGNAIIQSNPLFILANRTFLQRHKSSQLLCTGRKQQATFWGWFSQPSDYVQKFCVAVPGHSPSHSEREQW